MSARKHTSLDKVLGRLDQLDTANLHNLVQRLARERTMFEAVFNTLQEGVLVIDVNGVIEYANESAAGFTGATDMTGATLWRLVPGLRASLENGEYPGTAVIRELELFYPQTRTVCLYMVPFQSEGEGRKLAVILTDITCEKKSTEELIENEKVSSILLLAAGVAHELGNPLNSLTIHLQLIERKFRKLKKSKEARSLGDSIKICQDEVTRLDGIIRNFIEAIHPRPPDLSDLDLSELVREIVQFQAQELDDRGLHVDVDFSRSVPLISADRNQQKQVFFNLIKNAMEAMNPGGRLSIRVRSDDDSVYMAIADTGVGIKTDDLAKLFSPYHTTKPSGHGLGLMIVQRIMRDHGGHVGVESKEGVGTVVTLQFPQKNRRARMITG